MKGEKTASQPDRQTDRHTDRHTDRQTDRQTDRNKGMKVLRPRTKAQSSLH